MDIKRWRESGKPLVLEIGGNTKPQAHMVPGYEQAKIISLDVDPAQKPDIVCNAAKLPQELFGQMDGVFASHVLEHFSYWESMNVLREWAAALKDGGALHVVVPSWEWAAREVLSDKPSPALYAHSFAGQVNEWDKHLAMFTMRRLRVMFEAAGLSVTHARTGTYHLVAADRKEYAAEQHYICGIKGIPALKKE